MNNTNLWDPSWVFFMINEVKRVVLMALVLVLDLVRSQTVKMSILRFDHYDWSHAVASPFNGP
jgi:hypothetical protein